MTLALHTRLFCQTRALRHKHRWWSIHTGLMWSTHNGNVSHSHSKTDRTVATHTLPFNDRQAPRLHHRWCRSTNSPSVYRMRLHQPHTNNTVKIYNLLNYFRRFIMERMRPRSSLVPASYTMMMQNAFQLCKSSRPGKRCHKRALISIFQIRHPAGNSLTPQQSASPEHAPNNTQH